MLSTSTIQIVQSTVPVLASHGAAITKVFYQRLFQAHPELKHVFNQSNQRSDRQSQALATAVYAAAAHIDRLETLKPVLLPVLHKHRSLQIKPEMYPIVGHELLGAMQDVLGEAATPEILHAWGEAYGEIANLFITLEAELYAQDEQAKDFSGYQTVEISNVEEQADRIRALTFRTDGPLPAYRAGQYITVRIQDKDGLWHNRQYSLTTASNTETYTIGVKREGIVSDYLHAAQVGDTVLISAPAGAFTLDASGEPVVLIAGGIGITPMLAMADEALAAGRQVTLHHAVQDERNRPFNEQLALLEQRGARVVRYAEHLATDQVGRLPKDVIASITDLTYVCGPEAMIQYVIEHFTASPDKLHYEIFGPALAFAAETPVTQ